MPVRSMEAPFGGFDWKGAAAVGRSRPLWLASGGLAVAALVFGGGTKPGIWGDALVQLIALATLALVGARLATRTPAPSARVPLAILAAIVLLPPLQLVPLPPALWTAFPGRDFIVAAYAQGGIELPWRPLSLDPEATWRSFLGFLPAAAMFLAVLHLDAAGRRVLVRLLLGVGVLAVLLGLTQLMQGGGSPLRFFSQTHSGSAVGFFANRNHQAALLYCLLPMAGAWAIYDLGAPRRSWRGEGLAYLLVFAVLLVGIATTHSRAGFVLGVAASLLALLLAHDAWSRPATRHGFLAMFAALLIGAVVLTHYALDDLLIRFERGVINDYRFLILDVVVAAAKSVQPFGGGLGTFQPLYLMHDTPEAIFAWGYVNHAHNEWLQLLLEGGLPALLLAVAFLAWFAFATYKAWLRPPATASHLDILLSRAASVGIALLLVHSVVDYPLRTTALLTTFALWCGLLVEPPEGWSSPDKPTRKRRERPGTGTR